ncbi:hypothetical protein ACHQM5_021983 [Ranunculus cassubicifolius]
MSSNFYIESHMSSMIGGMKFLVFGAVILVFLVAVGAQITYPDEVKALQEIRRKLKDPMNNLKNWKKGDPCTSNWKGVVCFDASDTNETTTESTTENGDADDVEEEEEDPPPNDGYLHVKELNLLNMNLSGTLSPQLGKLSHLKILDFMWNNISGTIPKEIGSIESLELLVLNGNQLTGPLPEELGFLSNLYRLQIDENNISGQIPKSFANLNETKHLHMNNNSLSGQIPPELSKLPKLIHLLLDNNNLSGYLPPEFSTLPKLRILQLDNNRFDGAIPDTYENMTKLLKLSLRNCNLQGAVPDLSRIPRLGYVDLSWNNLSGSIPSNKLSENITTIDLSHNNLGGPIPVSFSGLPRLQRLSLENNLLTGDVPSTIWQDRILNETERLLLDFQNNNLSNISSIPASANVSIRLQGNPVCKMTNQLNIVQFCGLQVGGGGEEVPQSPNNTAPPCSCPQDYEDVKNSPEPCFCALPIGVWYRLKSPGFSNFLPYRKPFEVYLTNGLEVQLYQLSISSFFWETGRRLEMRLKLFPAFNNQNNTFNHSEVQRITSLFKGWELPDDNVFGPYDLIKLTLLGPYANEVVNFSKSGISKGAVAGIVLGAVAGAVIIYAVASKLVMRRRVKRQETDMKKPQSSKVALDIDGVKDFTFEEMSLATKNFSDSAAIGQGGYGKVYKGVLTTGTIVAVKRALEDSLQGEKAFFTEISTLSRVHHRNLVSLIGYCDEGEEQMLVYEYMPNGTVRDYLSAKSEEALGFAMRLRIALGSAKGILYLHSEANPPIFHRDIKTSNILLDSKFTAKVADFGLSKLAAVTDVKGSVPGHVSTLVKGTPGYLDPEYMKTNIYTDKSDVYSLGVVFLELLTRMHPISHGKNIVREVNLAYESGIIFSVIDGRMGSYPSACVEKFVVLALNCCQENSKARPSMAEVVRELEQIWFMLPESESEVSYSVETEAKSGTPKQVSTSGTRNLYASSSSDISGSNLVSGAMLPSITPR